MRDVGCRIATLNRLFDDAANLNPEGRNYVDGFRIQCDLDALTSELKDSGECNDIWAAQIEDLMFTPIAVDRRSLLIIPDDTFP